MEAVGDPWREDQHAGGGRRGQQQAERRREQRVDEHEQQHRADQPVPRVAGHPACERQEQHQRHRPRPQHARLEAGEVREPHDREPDHPPPTDRGDPRDAAQAQHAGHQDRHVGPAHRREVGEAGGLHGGAHVVGQQPGIARHEAHEQPAGRRWGAAGGSVADPVAHPLAVRRRPARRLDPMDHHGIEQDAGVPTRQPSAVAALGQRPRRGVEAPPLAQDRRVGRRIEADRRALPRASTGDLVHAHVHVPAGLDGAGLPSDDEGERRHAALCRQAGQQPLLLGSDAQARDADDDEQHRHDPRDASRPTPGGPDAGHRGRRHAHGRADGREQPRDRGVAEAGGRPLPRGRAGHRGHRPHRDGTDDRGDRRPPLLAVAAPHGRVTTW
jgi:hypothetical protein